uniref:Retrotransposon, putative, centromere-specific n=1 Tax=Oryza sativa subsp. japonica TaxID=39947 RepID=Q2R4C4_ORYSJ|nr:retrotransposon, putative, centromere-specific [Oryza sativa Japonica Group]
MAGLHKEFGAVRAQCGHFHLGHHMASDQHDANKVHDHNLARVESVLTSFDGKYDSAAYINWELAVEKQFDKYDFSNAQMIKAASNKFTGSASFWWHTGNKLETWDECKILMRKIFVFSYYRRALLEKLEHLKQGDKTVREYFHDFKICITYIGPKESNENTMTRFFRGLNSDIQAGLINVTYNHIGHLFMLACSVESNILKNPSKKQSMLVPPITDILQGAKNIHHEEKSNMIEMTSTSLTKEEEKTDAPTSSEERTTGKCAVNELNMSREEQPLVEPIAEMPLSQVDLLAVPYDKEELCDNASLKSMPQQKKQIILNGPCDEHHMEKPRTVFRKEGEDDVTMATTDTTVAHIIDEQDAIKIKSSKCWNPIRPPATLLTSNGRRIFKRLHQSQGLPNCLGWGYRHPTV